jgi:uncharacterized membrane protein YhaH (DUF805 family)
MINQQLLDFIKLQLSKGLTKEKITSDLLANGWTAQDIEEGFKSVGTPSSSIPIPPPSTFVPPDYIQPNYTISQQVNSPTQNSKQKVKFFSWKGRIGRQRYIITSIILGLILFIVDILLSIFIFPMMLVSAVFLGGLGFLAVPFMFLCLSLIESLISSFVVVKRFHDINKSGWYFLGLIVPFFNIYLILSLLLECGTDGPNNYGDDPLSVGTDHDGFFARLGRSVAFKLIVTLLLSALVILGVVSSALDRQETNQERINQTINQAMKNSPTPSSTSIIPPSVSPSSTASKTPSLNQSGKIVNTTTTSNGTKIPTAQSSASPLSCDKIKSNPGNQPLFSMCSRNGSTNACFNKYSGGFQGCVNSGNDCVVNNANASQNISCAISN